MIKTMMKTTIHLMRTFNTHDTAWIEYSQSVNYVPSLASSIGKEAELLQS